MAQVVTGQGAYGQFVSINLGFGLGVAMGIHVGGKVSGRTNDCCTAKESPKKKSPVGCLYSPQELT